MSDSAMGSGNLSNGRIRQSTTLSYNQMLYYYTTRHAASCHVMIITMSMNMVINVTMSMSMSINTVQLDHEDTMTNRATT